VIKSLGDGIMAAFEEPLGAIKAGVAIQRAIREWNKEEPDEPIDVGIGVSCGLPVMSDLDFIGHSVNLAQRLSDEGVRKAARLPAGLDYLSLGERILYGIGSEPIFEVMWLKEAARISDGRDRVTLVLTEDGTLVAEFAKDAHGGVRDALEELRRVRPDEEGAVTALLLRGMAALAERLLRPSWDGFGIAREHPIGKIRLDYRRGRLRVRTSDGTLLLKGVRKEEAEWFMAETQRIKGASGFE